MFQNNTAEKARCQPTFTYAAENLLWIGKWRHFGQRQVLASQNAWHGIPPAPNSHKARNSTPATSKTAPTAC